MRRTTIVVCTTAIVLLAFVLGLNTVVIRIVYKDFPGGSLQLANMTSLLLMPGTGSRYIVRRVSSDSSVILKCGSPEGKAVRQMGYLTTGLYYFVDLDVDGCEVRKFAISWFP